MFVLLGLLAGSAFAQVGMSSSTTNPAKTTSGGWSEDTGKTFGHIWKVCILLCLVLLIVDAVFRFIMSEKFLIGFFHSVRFIWFIYGSAAVWYIASGIRNYRGIMGFMYKEFYDKIYNGYFDTGYVGFFNNPIEFEGTIATSYEFYDSMLLENSLFFELIIFIAVRIGALVLQGGLAAGNPLSHFIGTLRRVFGWFFGLYFLALALQWFVSLDFYADFAKDNNTTLTGRAHFNVWLTWVIAIYVIAEVVFMLVEIILHAFQSSSAKSKAENYQETKNPSGGNSIQRSYDASIDEVTFMFLKKDVAIQSIFSLYFNFLVLFRWAFFVFLGVVFYNKPRTIYAIVLFSDLVAVVYTIFIFKSFTKLAGILILVSESLLLVRHLCQWINFLDQYSDGEMGQGIVDTLSYFAFFSYLIGTFIELFLVFEPFLSGTHGGSKKGMTPSQELQQLEQQNEHELENRVQTYKDMKSTNALKASKEHNQGQNPANSQVNAPMNNQDFANSNVNAQVDINA